MCLMLFQCKTVPISLTFSPDGKLFATLAMDRKVDVWYTYCILTFFLTKEICIFAAFGLFQALSVVGAGGTNTGAKNESGFPSP